MTRRNSRRRLDPACSRTALAAKRTGSEIYGAMQIETIDMSSPLLPQVRQLADANTDRLGFFPAAAFAKKASAHEILAASELGRLLGYLMFRRGRCYVTIEHLCVAEQGRSKGVGKALVGHLMSITQDVAGIDLHCRRDFEDSCRFWSGVGFQPMGEKPGRGKDARPLTHYVLYYGQRDLLDEAIERQARNRIAVVIDTNVFLDLEDGDTRNNPESGYLRADWLSGLICLHVTDEVFSDINRNPDQAKRTRLRDIAREYPKTRVAVTDIDAPLQCVKRVLPAPRSEQDKSDAKHIAYAIAAGVPYFVTRDQNILDHADTLESQFKMIVLRPEELIAEIDLARRRIEYEPAALIGTNIQCERLCAGHAALARSFLAHEVGERRRRLDREIRSALSDPHTSESFMIRDVGDSPLALVIMRVSGKVATVPVLRVAAGRNAPTLARCLCLRLCQIAAKRQCLCMRIDEEYLSDAVMDGLVEAGFSKHDGRWQKIILHGLVKWSDLVATTSNAPAELPTAGGLVRSFTTMAADSARLTPEFVLGVERRIWPGHLDADGVDTYIIPIQPRWAEHLFDDRLARTGLFGADPLIALNSENVYFRSGKQPAGLRAPARILWYVSSDRLTGKVQCIRATSILDEVVVGAARVVYRQFERLGVYRWSDVLGVAGGDPNGKVMALRFSLTEMLSIPVPRSSVDGWIARSGNSVPPLSMPYRIKDYRGFGDLYRLGQGQPGEEQ